MFFSPFFRFKIPKIPQKSQLEPPFSFYIFSQIFLLFCFLYSKSRVYGFMQDWRPRENELEEDEWLKKINEI
uniref:Uncharacterized protein n=1 Tax=Nelumbo nucifera TaxID=4432 RepID=A0A822YXA6_NELNU|nr:TPA_asm: hypothetical protein HUJ06_007818 [Nelumbo nucifera]